MTVQEAIGIIFGTSAIRPTLMMTFIAMIIWYIIDAVAYWKIFEKADEPGWKAIIPFYSDYICYKISWKTSMFWISLVTIIVGSFIANLDPSDKIMVYTGGIVTFVGQAIEIMAMHKLSKAFGHGVLFSLGLIFLDPIFKLILAFGSSEYMRNER